MRASSGTIRRGTAASQIGRRRSPDRSGGATVRQAIHSAHAYDRCGARGRRFDDLNEVSSVSRPAGRRALTFLEPPVPYRRWPPSCSVPTVKTGQGEALHRAGR
jgi:hypothetical protein